MLSVCSTFARRTVRTASWSCLGQNPGWMSTQRRSIGGACEEAQRNPHRPHPDPGPGARDAGVRAKKIYWNWTCNIVLI